jgi:hypothetical protein
MSEREKEREREEKCLHAERTWIHSWALVGEFLMMLANNSTSFTNLMQTAVGNTTDNHVTGTTMLVSLHWCYLYQSCTFTVMKLCFSCLITGSSLGILMMSITWLYFVASFKLPIRKEKAQLSLQFLWFSPD